MRCRLALAFVLLLIAAVAQFLQSLHSLVAQRMIRGQVRDQLGPIEGAVVRLQGHAKFARTGRDGSFALPYQFAGPGHVTAWKEGYFIAGVPADAAQLAIKLARLPAQDDECYRWVGSSPDPTQPTNCGNCHKEIYREWSASGHARSVNDRHFLNLYDGSDWQGRSGIGWNLLADRPDGIGVCTACHAPTVASLNDPAYFDLRLARGVHAGGVHCDYCHKIAAVANNHVGLTHGRFGLQLLRPAKGQLFFGPLDDVDRGDDTFSHLYSQSIYCVSCHEGTIFGVHVYSTFTEWLASPAARAGKQCQTCHMAPTGRLTNIAPGKGGILREPKTLANHRFFAGSQREMLRRCLHGAATLTSNRDSVRVEITVRAGQVGHRVPTGFVDRNLLLVVDGLDRHQHLVRVRRGPVLPKAVGSGWAGRAGRLYAKVLHDFDGQSPAPFWRADPDVVDNRLFPESSDASVYVFPPPVVQVRMRLLYRRFWQDVADVKGWPDNEITVLDKIVAVVPGRTTHADLASAVEISARAEKAPVPGG